METDIYCPKNCFPTGYINYLYLKNGSLNIRFLAEHLQEAFSMFSSHDI